MLTLVRRSWLTRQCRLLGELKCESGVKHDAIRQFYELLKGRLVMGRNLMRAKLPLVMHLANLLVSLWHFRFGCYEFRRILQTDTGL